MAKLQIVVKMSTSISVPLDGRELFDGSAKYDEIPLIRDPALSTCFDYTPNDGNHICYETYTTESCLSMENLIDPDTGDKTCTFDFTYHHHDRSKIPPAEVPEKGRLATDHVLDVGREPEIEFLFLYFVINKSGLQYLSAP